MENRGESVAIGGLAVFAPIVVAMNRTAPTRRSFSACAVVLWALCCAPFAAPVAASVAASTDGLQDANPGTKTVASAPERAPLRVAVIGASASAGFGCVQRETRADGEYAASFRLIDMIRLACPELSIVSEDVSSGFFFLMPVANGAKAAKRARAFKPDCVVAVDFLFWYCYGDDAPDGKPLKDEAQRLEKLEAGLRELDGLDVPMLVGDIPDMSRAVGKMLSPAQVPTKDTLAKANARVGEWAKSKPNVRMVPLAAMQRQLMEESALDIGTTRIVSTKEAPLLQRDELHPAPCGMAGLACAVATEIKAAVKIEKDDCEPDPKGTFERARGELELARRNTPAEPTQKATPATSGESPK